MPYKDFPNLALGSLFYHILFTHLMTWQHITVGSWYLLDWLTLVSTLALCYYFHWLPPFLPSQLPTASPMWFASLLSLPQFRITVF